MGLRPVSACGLVLGVATTVVVGYVVSYCYDTRGRTCVCR